MVDHQQDVAVPGDEDDDDGACDSFVCLHFTAGSVYLEALPYRPGTAL